MHRPCIECIGVNTIKYAQLCVRTGCRCSISTDVFVPWALCTGIDRVNDSHDRLDIHLHGDSSGRCGLLDAGTLWERSSCSATCLQTPVRPGVGSWSELAISKMTTAHRNEN